MDDYLNLLILSYFKQNKSEYSFRTLAKQLGTTLDRIEDLITALIDADKLKYIDNLLCLTPKGRLSLINRDVDFYDFTEQTIESIIIEPTKALPLNKVYVPKNFISKL